MCSFIGNAQGRYQSPDALPSREKPFLLSPLWDGAPFTIQIPRSTELLFKSKLLSSFDASARCSHVLKTFQGHAVVRLLHTVAVPRWDLGTRLFALATSPSGTMAPSAGRFRTDDDE